MSIKALLFPKLNQQMKRHQMPEFELGESIPRIIHQIVMRPAFQNRERELPPPLQANIERLRALNPGWEFRFYDDDDIAAFIKEHYPPVFWTYYERIDPRYGAARADFFRYLLMYKVGGVYLDIKSSASKPFDSVLRDDDRFVLSKWHLANGGFEQEEGFIYELRNIEGGEFQQWHIICAPGHPFLKAVMETILANIDIYDPHLHEVGKHGVLKVTGPITYTLAIHPLLAKYPNRVADGRNEIGLEFNIYGPNLGHVSVFKGHYSLQTVPIVKLSLFKRQLSHVYRLAQYLHDRLLRNKREQGLKLRRT